VLLNDGAGSFADSGQRLGDSETFSVTLGDLDGDGDLDAVLAGVQSAQIWWNDGQGSFTRSGQILRFSDRKALAISDFTGDGYPDIFAADSAGSWWVWVNQTDGTFTRGG
jgi:hypothetical protein